MSLFLRPRAMLVGIVVREVRWRGAAHHVVSRKQRKLPPISMLFYSSHLPLKSTAHSQGRSSSLVASGYLGIQGDNQNEPSRSFPIKWVKICCIHMVALTMKSHGDQCPNKSSPWKCAK